MNRAAYMWSRKTKEMEKLVFSQIRKPPTSLFGNECVVFILYAMPHKHQEETNVYRPIINGMRVHERLSNTNMHAHLQIHIDVSVWHTELNFNVCHRERSVPIEHKWIFIVSARTNIHYIDYPKASQSVLCAIAVTVQDVLCVDCKTSYHIILKPSKWRHTMKLFVHKRTV